MNKRSAHATCIAPRRFVWPPQRKSCCLYWPSSFKRRGCASAGRTKAAAQRLFASRRTWNAICQGKNKFHFGSTLPECPFWFPSSRRLIRRAQKWSALCLAHYRVRVLVRLLYDEALGASVAGSGKYLFAVFPAIAFCIARFSFANFSQRLQST